MNIRQNKIDRSSPVPIYYQIAMDMKERIAQNEWAMDERLPAENDLADDYQVSRITLRQAIAELEKDGVIVKYRGRGSFIHADPVPHVTKLNYSLVSHSQTPDDGLPRIYATVLEYRLVSNLFPAVYEHLGLRPDEKALYTKRLFTLDNRPVAIGRSHIPARLVPGMEDMPLIDNSLSATLSQRYNLSPCRVEDCIEAVRATQMECDILNCTLDSPLILLAGTSYLEDDTPLEYSTTLWAGDSIRLELPFRIGKNGFGAGT